MLKCSALTQKTSNINIEQPCGSVEATDTRFIYIPKYFKNGQATPKLSR